MVGCHSYVIDIFEDVTLLQDFMREHYEICVANRRANNRNHLNYDTRKFFELLLAEISNPMVSLSNQNTLLESTKLLINEGVSETMARQFGSHMANSVYKRIASLFQDLTFEQLANSCFNFISEYDIMFTFVDL